MAEPLREPEPPECIYCTNDRDISRRGDEWFCPVCSRTWFAYTVTDTLRLKLDKIAAK